MVTLRQWKGTSGSKQHQTIASSQATGVTLVFNPSDAQTLCGPTPVKTLLQPGLEHRTLGTAVPTGCCHPPQHEHNPLLPSRQSIATAPAAGKVCQHRSGGETLGLFLPKYRVRDNGLVEMELFHIPVWSADVCQGNKRLQPDHKTG